MLTNFEQATVEQLISFKAKAESDIQRLMHCEKLRSEAVALVQKWDMQRINKGLEPWNNG